MGDEFKGPPEWLGDHHTRRLARHYLERRKDAHERLLAACEQSSDPDVRGAYAAYVDLKEFSARLIGREQGSKNDDD